MKRVLKLLWAHIRCECYLWRKGMWAGEVKLITWGPDHRINLIGVIRTKRLLEIRRTFYISEELKKEVECPTTESAPVVASRGT